MINLSIPILRRIWLRQVHNHSYQRSPIGFTLDELLEESLLQDSLGNKPSPEKFMKDFIDVLFPEEAKKR